MEKEKVKVARRKRAMTIGKSGTIGAATRSIAGDYRNIAVELTLAFEGRCKLRCNAWDRSIIELNADASLVSRTDLFRYWVYAKYGAPNSAESEWLVLAEVHFGLNSDVCYLAVS